ncbi:hypothetical protein LguiB_013242 [Lonicera macranthoides]
MDLKEEKNGGEYQSMVASPLMKHAERTVTGECPCGIDDHSDGIAIIKTANAVSTSKLELSVI